MINRLPIVIAFVALAGGGTASAALAGQARDTPPAQSSQQENGSWAQNRTAFLNARLAALHAGLELTPDQEKLWTPVEQAMRAFCNLATSQGKARRGQEQNLNPVDRLEKRSDALIARGQALKKIADAAGPLYATLTDAQKERLPILLRAIHHPFMTKFRHHEEWRREGSQDNGNWRQGEDRHHDEDWRQGENRQQDEDWRDDNDHDHDRMEQRMRGDRMMMHHEDQDDNDGPHDNDND